MARTDGRPSFLKLEREPSPSFMIDEVFTSDGVIADVSEDAVGEVCGIVVR